MPVTTSSKMPPTSQTMPKVFQKLGVRVTGRRLLQFDLAAIRRTSEVESERDACNRGDDAEHQVFRPTGHGRNRIGGWSGRA
jgi:hypothetical protein